MPLKEQFPLYYISLASFFPLLRMCPGIFQTRSSIPKKDFGVSCEHNDIYFPYQDLDYSLQIGKGVSSKPRSRNPWQTYSIRGCSLERAPRATWRIVPWVPEAASFAPHPNLWRLLELVWNVWREGKMDQHLMHRHWSQTDPHLIFRSASS